MDHDRLFKLLLTTFFVEFIELFVPFAAAGLDRDGIQFLDKEIFTELGGGDRHEVDLLARVRLRGTEACFLIHIENQSSHRSDFPQRMFQYYARITGRFQLPVYPIAVFSYDHPHVPTKNVHSNELFGLQILRFEFHAIQLNRFRHRSEFRYTAPNMAKLTSQISPFRKISAWGQ